MRSELPWVKVAQKKQATPKGLLPTGNELQQRFQRRKGRRFEPRVSSLRIANPWATRKNTFGVCDAPEIRRSFFLEWGSTAGGPLA